MKIDFQWREPIRLYMGRADFPVYSVDLEGLRTTPGIYVFCRKWGKSFAPIYIGQAKNLRVRVKGQLNNARLMYTLKNSANGTRYLLHGYPKTKRGQQMSKILNTIEKAFIERAMGQGVELFNKQGTKRLTHLVSISGNRDSSLLFGKQIRVGRR